MMKRLRGRWRLMMAARALRDRGTPAPGRDPESFHVRSASVVLPPGASWVEGAMPRVMATPGRQLTLARPRAWPVVHPRSLGSSVACTVVYSALTSWGEES